MTIYTRPDEIVFAESAKNGEVIAFPDIARGWGITFEQTDGEPPLEWFNALTKQQFEAVRYLMQRGAAEWSTTEDYPANALVQFDGSFYTSLQESQGKNPSTNPESWISFDNKFAAKTHTHDQYVSKKDILKDMLNMFVGMPFPYPLANAPEGWVSLDGAAINPANNPKLASLYGGYLPDLRGVFIRGWDKGRGIDLGRTLGPWLSYQEDTQQAWDGYFYANDMSRSGGQASGVVSGLSNSTSAAWTGDQNTRVRFRITNQTTTRTATENRSKNIAFHYITPAG